MTKKCINHSFFLLFNFLKQLKLNDLSETKLDKSNELRKSFFTSRFRPYTISR